MYGAFPISEEAFFYSKSTQQPARRKSTSTPAHPNAPGRPPPIPSLASKQSSSEDSKTSLTLARTRSNPASTDGGPSSQERMPPTPLVDYKHTANQAAKGRAPAPRKSSSTSGTNSERKNALPSADSRAPATAQGQRLDRSSSASSSASSDDLPGVTVTDPPSTDALSTLPFSKRNGRRYLRDMSLPYPLPCDLMELHRQTLRTMLLCQVFNGPICSSAFESRPPKRVLEVACGTGFWSVMCHRHFTRKGFSASSFTGIDIAPLAPRMEDDDMNWRFVQHDLRRVPLPFRDEEFNLIMIKDLSLVTPTTDMQQQELMDEYLRILKPGGTLEIWDGDHSLRMLLPHAPPSTKEDEDDSEDEDQVYTNAMGIYTLTPQTPLKAPHNQFLVDYNVWITKALEARRLTAMPCTSIRPMLLQEAEDLVEIDYRRLAIPLGEVRWEREGVGGAVTQGANGISSAGIASKGKGRESDRKLLTAGQAALRRTALTTVVQMIESMEPLLRDASGKGQDEWDRWHANMMNDLLNSNGTSWGECLEVGAWWARKKPAS